MNGTRMSTRNEMEAIQTAIEVLSERLKHLRDTASTHSHFEGQKLSARDLAGMEMTDMYRADAPARIYDIVNMRLFAGDWNRDRINIVYYTTDKANPHLRDFIYCNDNNPAAYARASLWWDLTSDARPMPKDTADIINDDDLAAPRRVLCQPHPVKRKKNGEPLLTVVGYEF